MPLPLPLPLLLFPSALATEWPHNPHFLMGGKRGKTKKKLDLDLSSRAIPSGLALLSLEAHAPILIAARQGAPPWGISAGTLSLPLEQLGLHWSK